MLGPDATQALRRRGQRRQYRRREVVFREGDLGDSVYFIERGHVVVKGERTPGETLTLAVLGPGDYFGDVAVLSTGGRRSAGVETLDVCVTFIVPGSDFVELRDRYPEIRRAMTESLARTCRRLVERLVDGRHIDVRGPTPPTTATTARAVRWLHPVHPGGPGQLRRCHAGDSEPNSGHARRRRTDSRPTRCGTSTRPGPALGADLR